MEAIPSVGGRSVASDGYRDLDPLRTHRDRARDGGHLARYRDLAPLPSRAQGATLGRTHPHDHHPPTLLYTPLHHPTLTYSPLQPPYTPLHHSTPLYILLHHSTCTRTHETTCLESVYKNQRIKARWAAQKESLGCLQEMLIPHATKRSYTTRPLAERSSILGTARIGLVTKRQLNTSNRRMIWW